MLVNPKPITFEEFLEIDKNTEGYLEFINGVIYAQASPSTEHQRITTRLSSRFENYFRGKDCESIVSPYDIYLQSETERETHRVQPDLSVICDKSGFRENNYVGVPTLVIEVLSPSTASKDFIEKMNVYMRFGVKEYWIVSPKNKEVQIFALQEGVYREPISYKDTGIIRSVVFEELYIQIEEIFS